MKNRSKRCSMPTNLSRALSFSMACRTCRCLIHCTSVQLEMAARVLYQEAATHCHSVKDYVSRDLFEKLMHDEEEHIDLLETQLDLVGKLGLGLYAQHHIGTPEDD